MKVMPSISLCRQNQFKQRVRVRGARPEEEEIFQFTMIQVPVTVTTSPCFLTFQLPAYFERISAVESWRLVGWLLGNANMLHSPSSKWNMDAYWMNK